MKILVVGMGLIGGSVCKALKAGTDAAVYGCDVERQVLHDAVNEGVIDGIGSLDEGTYDVYIICLHQRTAKKLLAAKLPSMTEGSIVTDMCGLKGAMVYELTTACRAYGIRYVGTHPMAGREKSGYYASIPNLFHNANFIVTPIEETDSEALETVIGLAKSMGFGKIVRTTPEHHDDMIAYTSQLAHVVSSSYVKDDCMDDAVSFSGGSFQDMTRVATMDEYMWSSLFLDNKERLLHHLELMISNLEAYREALAHEDEEALRQLILYGRLIQEENVKKRLINKERNKK